MVAHLPMFNVQKERKLKMYNKILGSLVGFAIGDAMGATTEFMSEKDIKKTLGQVTDIIGGGWLNLKAGEVTDDTQMTLCVCEAIDFTFSGMEVKLPFVSKFLDRCCNNFSDWFDEKPKDIGGTCRRVISLGKSFQKSTLWFSLADDPDALGNGSLMRTMPIVLSGLGSLTAMLQGRLTHNNETCDTVIKRYYNVLEKILNGHELKNSMVDKLYEPTGHVLNTLNNSLYWATKTDTFEDAIIGAVNHGGDADTIAAITGSLVGAKYGFDAIPSRWIDQLDSNVLEKMKKYTKIFEKVCTNSK